MDSRYSFQAYADFRSCRRSATAGALMLAGRVALWLGTRTLRSVPVRLLGSVIEAALLPTLVRAGRSADLRRLRTWHPSSR